MSNRVTSLTVNGAVVASRSGRAVPVADGATVAIEVVAPDRTTTSRYVLTLKTVRRGA
jgi:hypothetical protein